MSTRSSDPKPAAPVTADPHGMARLRAESLSRELCGPGGETALRILRGLGPLVDECAASKPLDLNAAQPPEDGKDRVGIWQRDCVGEPFVRSSERMEEWALWADIHALSADFSGHRIALVGESVARGFLYDPVETPARALQRMLDAAAPAERYEVVDLARTGADAACVLDTLRESKKLAPDLVVVFAGNNWRADCWPRDERLLGVAQALREGGVIGLKRCLEERLGRLAADVVRQVAAIAGDTPAILVIPEFNLADWHAPDTARAPWLGEAENAEWCRQVALASEALQRGDTDAATEAAGVVCALDGGTSPAGLAILARCQEAHEEPEQKRVLLEAARDARLWDPVPETPRAPRCVTEAMRRQCEELGLPFVDLRSRLEESLDGSVPDRRVFLDYCHLTWEGIRVSMASVASSVLAGLGQDAPALDTLASSAGEISETAECDAHFAAAIHNAHWGQPEVIVQYHCDRAARSVETRQSMRYFAEMQARRAPMWMCGGTESLAAEGRAALRRYVLSYATTDMPKLFDRILLDSLGRALDHHAAGIGMRLLDLRIREDAVERASAHGVDLLEPRYAPFWFHPDWWTRMGPNADLDVSHRFFRAHSPESRFPFACAGDGPFALTICCRAALDETDNFALRLDGIPLCTLPLDKRWTTHRVDIPSGRISRGINQLQIDWPKTTPRLSASLEAVARNLELARVPELVPAFGEIHTLTMHGASGSSIAAESREETARRS